MYKQLTRAFLSVHVKGACRLGSSEVSEGARGGGDRGEL